MNKITGQQTWRPVIVSVSALIAITWISFFSWELVEILTPFGYPILLGLVTIFFLAWLVTSLVLALKKRRKENYVALAITIATLAIWIFTPFTTLWLKYDWHIHRNDRIDVVARITNGSIETKPQGSETIHLNNAARGTSRGGNDVWIVKKDDSVKILFFTYRGILDNFSGYLYVSDDKWPTEFVGSEPIQVIRAEKNWYFVAFN